MLSLQERSDHYQLQYENFLDHRDYLMHWGCWEWFCTFPFPAGVKYPRAHGYFNDWRRNLEHNEKIQFAAHRVTRSKRKVLHMHALAFGRNREGETLSDCSTSKWEARWPFKIKATIGQVYDQAGACEYLAKHMLVFLSAHAQFDSFNLKLLDQYKEVRHDGLDNLYRFMENPDGPCIGGPDDCEMDLEQ